VLVISPGPLIHAMLVKELDARKETGFLRKLHVLATGCVGTEVKIFDAHTFLSNKSATDKSDDILVRMMKEHDVTVVTQQMLVAGKGHVGDHTHDDHRCKAIAAFGADPPLFDLIIMDEAHHTPAPTWKRMLDLLPEVRTLGLTATPFRTDNQTPPHDKKLAEFNVLDGVQADPPTCKNVVFLEVTPLHAQLAQGAKPCSVKQASDRFSDKTIKAVVETSARALLATESRPSPCSHLCRQTE
jgi:hypothetical protein